MDDKIGAQGDLALQGGRQERVVNVDLGTDELCASHDIGDVSDSNKRIARRFDQYQHRYSFKGSVESRWIIVIDEGNVELSFGCALLQETKSAAITIMRRDEEIIRFEARQNEVNGGRAARCDYGAPEPPSSLARVPANWERVGLRVRE